MKVSRNGPKVCGAKTALGDIDNYSTSADSLGIEISGKESEKCSDDVYAIVNKNITLNDFCLLPAISGARSGILVAIICGTKEDDTDKTVETTVTATESEENAEKVKVTAVESIVKHLSRQQNNHTW